MRRALLLADCRLELGPGAAAPGVRMTPRRVSALGGAFVMLLGLVACGGSTRNEATGAHRSVHASPAQAPSAAASAAHAPRSAHRRVVRTPALQALVTAQTEDRVFVVDVRSGRVVRRITVPGEPGYVAATGSGGPVVVVSSAAGVVTVLSGRSLHATKFLGGFGAPHIPEISPDGQYAYVTDDARGQVDVIRLVDDRVVSRTFVGAGAHHFAFSPDGQRVWVALGQSASTIVILSTVVARPRPPASVWVNPGHPRVIGRLEPGYAAHDLLFSPDGRRVWITAADGTNIGVFSARTHQLLFRVPAGPPPQHLVFAGPYGYVTSGYGSRIERVSLSSGRVLRRAAAPYGSFDLDAAGGYVVTSSLLRGTLAVYDTELHLLRVLHLAPSAEDVALFRP